MNKRALSFEISAHIKAAVMLPYCSKAITTQEMAMSVVSYVMYAMLLLFKLLDGFPWILYEYESYGL